MIFLLAVLCFLYVPVIGWLLIGALKLPRFTTNKVSPSTKFSIVIPFRNEAENLEALLQSLYKLDYPSELYEVIFVDDDSTDASVPKIEQFTDAYQVKSGFKNVIALRIIQNKRYSNSPKKDAISAAVKVAKNEWIVSTDADCVVPSGWLRWYDQCIQKKQPKMVCGPVVYPSSVDLVSAFQVQDGLSLQLVTMGSFGWKQPLISNGANMAYLKRAFVEVKGYHGNNHIASGDDVFLLGKFRRKYPSHVHYLKNKEATVETQAESSWKSVLAQRIRWASKTSRQKSGEAKFLGLIVFLTNFAFLMAMTLVCVQPGYFKLFLAFVCIKLGIDLAVIYVASHFLEKRFSIPGYLIMAFFYPFIAVWVVLNSLTGNYRWKERTFKK